MPSSKRNLELGKKAEAELSGTRDPVLRIKLRAIASAAHHPVQEVADIMGVSRQTIRRGMKNYRETGLEGLRDRPKGHRRPKLTREQLDKVAGWLYDGKRHSGEEVDWTLEKLQDEILKQFDVKLGITPLWRWVRKMGFGQVNGKYLPIWVYSPTNGDVGKKGGSK